jgi:hypothetical protein
MANAQVYPAQFLAYNKQLNKNVILVLKLDGYSTLLTSGPISGLSAHFYGDAGLVYGATGVTYGDGSSVNALQVFDLENSSVTISQTVEPEQGRGSVSTISLGFVDLTVNGQPTMSNLIAPGIVLTEILGTKCNLYLGFSESSYPDDYLLLFRGFISGVDSVAGKITFQLSDINMFRRQDIFSDIGNVYLTQGLPSVSTLPIFMQISADPFAAGFYEQIKGPDGTYDSTVTCYIIVDSEVISYNPGSFITLNNFTSPINNGNQAGGAITIVQANRGQRGTSADSHAVGATVTAGIQFGPDHFINIALKLMLSGWNGPWVTGIPLLSLGVSIDSNVSPFDLIVFPSGVDVIRDFGVSIGDWVTISGATNPTNDATEAIAFITDYNGEVNNAIIISQGNSGFIFTPESTTLATIAFRSQFDTYPIYAGNLLSPNDVDVQGHISLRDNFFGSQLNEMQFYITASESCKDFIESELYLPAGCYTVTRFGRLSVNATHAPLNAADATTLTADNVIYPERIKTSRAINNRKLWNEIDWSYDYDDQGNFDSLYFALDSVSINNIGLVQILPITSRGIKSALGAAQIVPQRSSYLLGRYSIGATQVELMTNMQVGAEIETGDVILLIDNGTLQISNFVTGQRNLGSQYWEVINRRLDIKSGTTSLTLINGVAPQGARFGLITPSSVVAPSGSTILRLGSGGSFGWQPLEYEYLKWQPFIGQNLILHDPNYIAVSACNLTAVSVTGNYLTVSGFGGTPSSAMTTLDLANYQSGASAVFIQDTYGFIDNTAAVTGSINSTSFGIAASALPYIKIGLPIYVHSSDYSVLSNESLVTNISGSTITVAPQFTSNYASSATPLTPAAGYLVELGAMPDGSQPFRIL